MRSSNAGLWLKAQSCTEALITVVMHQVETMILLPSHSQLHEEELRNHYLFNCATGAFTGEIREPGGKRQKILCNL